MKKLSIIYDVTKLCPWNCNICCMGAEVSKDKCTDELTKENKFKILEYLKQLIGLYDVHMDLSGGEIMTDTKTNLELIDEVSKVLGKDHLGISTSGYKMTDEVASFLSTRVQDVEMTMDTLPGIHYELRPVGYAMAAANAIPILKKYGIRTGIQTVLTKSNSSKENLKALYEYLCENRVDEWSILRFYPTGRGINYKDQQLTEEQSLQLVQFIQKMDAENKAQYKPKLSFHYTMKGHSGYTSECRCVKKSIGILPNGIVTSCFWASDEGTKILDQKFELGNIKDHSLYDILENKKSEYWRSGCHGCELLSA